MKRFLALISVTTMLCMLLTGCTNGGNVSKEPNGSITSNPNDRQTDAASELMPTTTHRNETESSTTHSGSTEHSENTNGTHNGTNGNGTHNGTNDSSNTENTENSIGAPQSRGYRRF
ncbi:MAG: hypothetical protein PUF80_06375 [Firmicutes bacterium]|nr:hypothetical protein [Bacillota bacterium]